MLVFSASTFLLMNKYKFSSNLRLHVFTAISAQILILCRAFYQGLYLHAERIPLSAMGGDIGEMGAATVAAYMITFVSLYASIVFLTMQSKYKWPLFYINFVLTFAAIMMTGTRAAFVTYPLMIIILLFLQHKQQKAYMIKVLLGFIILLVGCGMIFSKDITKRVDDLQSDLISYNDNNLSTSSVGARLSMIQAGFASRPDELKWQSLEQRADKIIRLSNENSLYKGASIFLDVHMHNELAEAVSTKGISGIVALIIFYIGLIYYCVREKNYLLLVFPAAIIMFGLSDVITHAKPIPASWIVSLLLSIAVLGNKKKDNI